MQEQECTLDVKTIEAAVAGDIVELATVEIEQPDGSVKKIVDEDLKQQIGLKLLEEIPNFPLEKAKKEAVEE